jgi:hypothetical protein
LLVYRKQNSMKKLIVLSGNSAKNQAWGEGVVEHFSAGFDDAYMQYYDHWQSGEVNINLDAELSKLKLALASDDATVEYFIFAKSIGSLMALKAVEQQIITPTKCVFFGMPLDYALTDLFKTDLAPLASFAVPAIAFHNQFDPTANYEIAQNALEKYLPSIELITLPGDNHNYTEFSDYEVNIKNFLA